MGSAAPVTPASAAAHVFVDDLDTPRLAPDDRHHLLRVLRLAPGRVVTVGDGAGRWRAAELTAGQELAALGEVVADAPPAPPITVAFALVKGDRPELVVQKATELGADHIVPFVAERSVIRWEPERAGRQASRLRAVARAAAMQCRRTWLPEVAAVATFAEVAALPGAALADAGGGAPTLAYPTVLVGPEGGWSSAERASDLPRVRLGSHILRAETASITICALLASLRDRIITETPEQFDTQ